MTDSEYKSLVRSQVHDYKCRFTEPCHFRSRFRGYYECACLSDCGFGPEYDDCPFRKTNEQVKENGERYPFDSGYAEAHQ